MTEAIVFVRLENEMNAFLPVCLPPFHISAPARCPAAVLSCRPTASRLWHYVMPCMATAAAPLLSSAAAASEPANIHPKGRLGNVVHHQEPLRTYPLHVVVHSTQRLSLSPHFGMPSSLPPSLSAEYPLRLGHKVFMSNAPH